MRLKVAVRLLVFDYFPVLLAFVFGVALALFYLKPIAADIHFHWVIAEEWANFRLGMFCDVALSVNKMPYPPLLHFLLVPGFWLNCKVLWTLGLQVLFFPLAVFALMKVMEPYGRGYALVAGLVALGSFAYVDRLIQVQPQALDLVLLPLAFYYRGKPKLFVAVSGLLIWNHGVIAVFLLLGLWLIRLYNKQVSWRNVLQIAVVSLPVMVPSFLMLSDGLNNFVGGYETIQETLFWTSPVWVVCYLRLPIVGFVFAFLNLKKWKCLDVLERESMVSLLCMVPFVLWQADRFLQYGVVPLSFLLAFRVKPVLEAKNWLLLAVLIFFVFMYWSLWMFLFLGCYDVH